MRILDKLQQTATGMRRADDLWRPPVDIALSEQKSGEIQDA